MEILNRKVIVTGGAGFIGSELVYQLVEKGADVVVIDNLINGKKENLDGVPQNKLKLFTTDIRNYEEINSIINDVDIIFHLACLGVRHSIHSPYENHDVNASATLQLLQLARKNHIKKFVYVSSSEVYGTARFVPMNEDHPTYPKTVYGSSKLAGECYTRAFFETYDFDTVIVRPFNTYGHRCHHEGDSGEVIPKFLLRGLSNKPMIIFGDGNQTRDFTYVQDTAIGILKIGLTEGIQGQTINLGSGREISLNELANKVAQVTGKQEPDIIYDIPRPGDVLRLYADINKAEKIVSFQPNVTLIQGLTKLKDWYLSLGQTPEDLLKQESIRNWKINDV